MNLQQLEYIVAVDKERHFVRAAKSCFITQATLSAMIKKLEKELDCSIFDRNQQPVVPTQIGENIIKQAKTILKEVDHLNELVKIETNEVSGMIRIGIIPTMAPNILPLLLSNFLKKHPKVHLKIKELTTDEILKQIDNHEIDYGILATPLHTANIIEIPMFYEEFILYADANNPILEKREVKESDINPDDLWILEEGHCLRSQVINFCNIKQQDSKNNQLEFEAGSIQTLINLVDNNGGITILPELSIQKFKEDQMEQIRFFKAPYPVREVSLIFDRNTHKHATQKALFEAIREHIPEKMINNKDKFITPINL
jgi:LysR family hydrogen peroxide-inducible transcriptional activator